MAFGKDREVLEDVGSFGQSTANFSRRPQNPRRGKGGGGLWFFDTYKPSLTTLDNIRLVSGLYENLDAVGPDKDNMRVVTRMLPFFKFVQHFDAMTDKSSICSAGPLVNFKDLRNPCAGCDVYWATRRKDEGGKMKSRVSFQPQFALTMFDMGKWHKVPQLDHSTGKVKVNTRTNEAFFNWNKCQGFNCDACRANLETKMGHRTHWAMASNYWETIRQMDGEVGKNCTRCTGEGTVASMAWLCRECGNDAIDMRSTTLKLDEINTIVTSTFSCPLCKHEGFLEEFVFCQQCKVEGFGSKHKKDDGAQASVRATLFDVDLQVRSIRTGNNNQTNLQIAKWSAAKPVAPEFAELNKPMDLPAIFAPTSFKDQCARFQWDPPLVPGAPNAAPPAQPYGQQQQGAPPAQAPGTNTPGDTYR
jgi:hypothetical protein